MRILTATGIFHPESGGPATYLYGLLPELQARGHNVEVITFGEGATAGYPYPVTRISRHAPYPLRQWQYFRTVQQAARGADSIFVHSLGIPLPKATVPRIAKIVGDQAWERAMNRGWVPPHTDIDTFQEKAYTHPLVRASKAVRSRKARSFTHIIVPSHYMKEMIAGWGVPEDKITVIYNALHTQPIPPDLSQAEARAALGLNQSAPLLLCVARLTPWKNIHLLINAVKHMPDVHLIVAGDGPLWDELNHHVTATGLEQRVHFTGRVPREKMPLYYRAADYTILYSSYEGLSHVLLESLMIGTPVIASAKGGNLEVVNHGINGLLAPYEATHEHMLTDTLRKALEPRRSADLAAGTSHGLERFTWGAMVKQTVHVLEQYT